MWSTLQQHLLESLKLSIWTEEANQAPIEERLILNTWGIQGLLVLISPTSRHIAAPPSPRIWGCPPVGFFKYNFEGASKCNPGAARYGGVVRDDQGKIRGIAWGALDLSTNNVAELEGLVMGMQWALGKG